ncbi:MFS general substrate transporter [Hesseltinella vesiculosa]|uniref:MFS general substrate transporter n=1 Tax=Hesseltinella vesiculosa TaxID=101127 RepID=A0A1X2GFG5_9FUNG|nr:MFS general substrate transporter [Hesseltinella vesiculosa]
MCLLFSVFSSLAAIVYLATAQSFIILARLDGTASSRGSVTGSLSFYSELVSVVFVVVWGVVSDHHEKRLIMALGLGFMGIPLIALPYVRQVYPDLLLIRLFFSVGTAGTTTMMTAFVMEVVQGKGGWVPAMLGASSGLGAIFAAFCLFSVPTMLNLRFHGDQTKAVNAANGIIGGCVVLVGLVSYVCLPRWCRALSRGFVNFAIKLLRGLKAAKDPHVGLGYCTSFFARADEVIITNFISLWVTQYYIEKGICANGSICYAASGSTGTMTGIAQCVALVACPFFGAASEYLAKELAIVAAGAIGAAGCLAFSFSLDPTSKTSMAMVILIAIGEYAMIVSGMSLVAGKHVAVEDRGSVAGTYSFCGAVGILVLSKVGGVLFDVWMKGAPFLLLGVGHLLIMIAALALYCWQHFFKKGK